MKLLSSNVVTTVILLILLALVIWNYIDIFTYLTVSIIVIIASIIVDYKKNRKK